MGLNLKWTQSRMGLNLEWTQHRMGLNLEWTQPQMGLNLKWTQPRMGLSLEWDFLTPEWWDGTQHRMDLKIMMLSCRGLFFTFSTITRGLYSFGIGFSLFQFSVRGLSPGGPRTQPRPETQPRALFLKVHSFYVHHWTLNSRLIEILG